jgi:type IV pilus assembly protein PilQ
LVELATAYLTRLDARVRQVAVNVKVIDISLANTTEINASSAFRFSNNQYFISNSGSAFLNFGSNSTNAPLPGGFAVPPYGFLLSVQAQITNGNAKILTDPTLIVQENQQATVNMTQQVLTSITCTNSTTSTSTSNGTNSSLITCTPVFSNAGLTLTVNVDKIDDNGYISLSVAPTIAAPYSTVVYNSGAVGANNTFTLLDTRSLTSGLIRLRDAQTLVLSGIITSSDKTTISKVPILGDIPLLGALFRKTNSENNRGELIILLTPHILNEQNDNQLGEGYSPTPKAAEELKQQAFPWTK